jgi:hypothetical protein
LSRGAAPVDHGVCHDNKQETAAAARIGAALARRKRTELLGLLRLCFARTEPWLRAGEYAVALMSQMPKGNEWILP